MKRLLKEAYRLHQHTLSAFLREKELAFHGALMANAVDVPFKDVEHDVVALLEQVRDQLPAISSANP